MNRHKYSLPFALRTLLVLFALCALPFPVRAQSTNATLSGTVTDQNGAVIPGVEISVINPATSLERTAKTGDSGEFTVPLLPPANYVVTAKRDGFSPVKISVTLNVGDQKALQIQLKAGDVNATVTVSSDAETVRTDGSVGTVVNRQQIANMPLNGRSLHALIQLTPGVVLTTASGGVGATGQGQFSINGQRTNANYFMVDGVSANTGISVGGQILATAGSGTTPGTTVLGGTNSLVSLDALQEFRIETSSYGAEYGRTPGGQISLVTRGGTNEFHGSGSYYFRNEALDANEWFANRAGLKRARERQNLFSAVFSGPLYVPRFGEGRPALSSGKDRAFFFFSYEGLSLQLPKTGATAVPTVALRSQAPAAAQPYLNISPLPNGRALNPGFAEFNATYSDPASFNIWSLRLDTNVAKQLTAFVRVSHAPSESQTRSLTLSTIVHQKAVENSTTGGGTWVVKPTLTVDLRANWTTNSPHQFYTLDTFGGAIVPDISQIFLPGWGPSTDLFSFVAGDSSGFIWGQGTSNAQRQFNIVGTSAWSIGSHQLKFGVDYRRLLPLIRGGSAPVESARFSSVANIKNGLASYFIRSVDTVERKPILPSLSLFAQDTWHASRRLTLTYGLRVERVPPATEATGQLPRTLLGIENNAIINPRLAPAGTPLWKSRLGELAPRLGVAYQLRDQKGWESTIRGGGGIFYDLGLGSIVDAYAAAYPYTVLQNFGTIPFPPPASTRIPPDLNVPIANGATVDALDPDLRLPYTIQWNGSWEQALGAKQTVTISYVGALGRRLILNQSAFGVHLADNPTASVNLVIQRPIARSSYRALQSQFQRRFDRRFQVFASYTLSRSMDNASDEGVFAPSASVPALLAQEWGPSSFDVRHAFSASVTYELPNISAARLVQAVTRGWGVDTLIRYQSAFAVNPQVTTIVGADGIAYNIRPNLVSGQPLYIHDAILPGGRRINVAAFSAPPAGQQGNFQRNGARGFAAQQIDLALRREFKLSERVRLQLRGEFFNLFNTPNFAGINTNWSATSTTFGVASNTLGKALGGLNALYQMGGPRSGQLSVKLLF